MSTVPESTREKLTQIRYLIKKTVPQAQEKISYKMPSFYMNGMLVWYAGFKDHIGFFPKTSAIEKFRDEITPYKISKGTIRFPLDKPLPLDLIKKIVEFRVSENLKKEDNKYG